jgi:site-specific recombinase XerD
MQARPLTTEEIAKLRAIFENGYGPYRERDRCLFELGINAGGRISEILALTVGQVSQYGRVVERLELVETKGGRPRAIPLNSKAQEAISQPTCSGRRPRASLSTPKRRSSAPARAPG